MELSFRTYGMLGGFVTTAILLYVQVSVIPSGFGNLLYSVLGISAGVVLFVIECLDFWRYAEHASARFRSCPLTSLATLICSGSAATESGATAARNWRTRQRAWSDTSRTTSIAASCMPSEELGSSLSHFLSVQIV